jgi:hypothetical protein
MASPSVFDHVSSDETDHPDGIYRVVGTSDDGVTLLRVGDADGRRRNTGVLLTVGDDEFERFDAAGNPDGNRPAGVAVTSAAMAAYWSGRILIGRLADRPRSVVVAVALVSLGVVGNGTSVPDPVVDILLIGGVLVLAYAGRG